MGFCTGLFPSGKIETEIFPASMAEFIEVLVQGGATDFTVMNFHTTEEAPNPNIQIPNKSQIPILIVS